jgi:hypothetical protein
MVLNGLSLAVEGIVLIASWKLALGVCHTATNGLASNWSARGAKSKTCSKHIERGVVMQWLREYLREGWPR